MRGPDLIGGTTGGSSYKLAAEELDLHFNSVKYRVGRAVARRGRELGADRLDVELALVLCQWYGISVLQQGCCSGRLTWPKLNRLDCQHPASRARAGAAPR